MGWRPLLATDLALLVELADTIHRDHPESPEALASRLQVFPAGCFIAEGGNGLETEDGLGYCLSHPGTMGQPPALDCVLTALPARPDCLYLHDLALLPEARSQRLGEAMVALLTDVARAHGLDHIALTAVSNSWGFWERQGFERRACPALAGYGAAAVYMVKALSTAPR
jgi:ribosomal protein S18 acetylase RimI-like enzyme